MNETDAEDTVEEHLEIVNALRAVEVGDELTVEAENGYRDNRTVTGKNGDKIVFGDPATEQARLLRPDRATVHKFPDRAEDEDVAGWLITKLWVFQ